MNEAWILSLCPEIRGDCGGQDSNLGTPAGRDPKSRGVSELGYRRVGPNPRDVEKGSRGRKGTWAAGPCCGRCPSPDCPSIRRPTSRTFACSNKKGSALSI